MNGIIGFSSFNREIPKLETSLKIMTNSLQKIDNYKTRVLYKRKYHIRI